MASTPRSPDSNIHPQGIRDGECMLGYLLSYTGLQRLEVDSMESEKEEEPVSLNFWESCLSGLVYI
jgi:hypothetical protein